MKDLVTTIIALDKITDFSKWDWEQFVSTGMVVRELKDRSQWYFGKLALGVEKKYGQDRLGDFSKEVGINPASMKVYRWVAKNFKNLNQLGHLPYFAFQLSAGTSEPREWIKKAVENGWSTSQLQREIAISQGREITKKSANCKCPNCGFEFKPGLGVDKV